MYISWEFLPLELEGPFGIPAMKYTLKYLAKLINY